MAGVGKRASMLEEPSLRYFAEQMHGALRPQVNLPREEALCEIHYAGFKPLRVPEPELKRSVSTPPCCNIDVKRLHSGVWLTPI